MLKKTLVYLTVMIVFIAASSGFARNILEKKITYLDNAGKTGQARFWVIYLGNYDLKLTRKFAGEPEQQVDASTNLQILSSGYVEGNGYCAKGKVDCRPVLNINTPNGARQIDMDSIDYIYDYGAKVAMIGGETGDLLIDIEGDKQTGKKFIMREFKLTEYFGEEILKEGAIETPLAAFSLTKDGITRAKKAQVALETK